MLGQAVCRAAPAGVELITPGREQLDIADPLAVDSWLDRTRPGWVIHLAAMTNVDQCQREPALAYQVNSTATAHLAAACRRCCAGLLFLSSIAVFDGQKPAPYDEMDLPRPGNVYGDSKWQAEQVVATLPRHLIVRSGWLFGGGPADKKFVSQMLALAPGREELAVVADKIGSPTSVDDLAGGLWRLLREEASGLFHLVNSGEPVSRYDLARAILAAAGLPTRVRPVTSDHFPHLAPRPGMEAATSHKTVGWLRPWRPALIEYVHALQRAQAVSPS
jgi:dTDP-4-dehydrorhamnose reductase